MELEQSMLREGPFEGPASALRREMRRAEREEVEPQGTTHSVAVSPDELRVAVESPGSTRAQLGVPEHGTDRAEPGRIGSDLGGVDPTTDNPTSCRCGFEAASHRSLL